MLVASAVCPKGCDVGVNWDGFVMSFDIAISPNLVGWPVIAVTTVTLAVCMAHIEQRLVNRRK